MKLIGRISMILFAVACVYTERSRPAGRQRGPRAHENPVPLKEAKLNIEHNATDRDTGFRGIRRQRGLAAPQMRADRTDGCSDSRGSDRSVSWA